jgi:catechol 2,3-dioxygenase-like lactoylglutathione lyase family enzyme
MSFVDHIIIAVEELEQASADYALMLGRAPSWRGTHPDYGSANTLFRLDNCYLELLAADKNGGEGWAGDMIRGVLQRQGQSLCALIFGTDDCAAFLENARAHGLEASDPVPGHGVDDTSGATRTWQNMHWDMSAARGIFSFCIRHDDLSAVPMAAIEGAGPVTAVDHVVVQTKSAAAAKKFYGDQLGIRLALEQDVPDWGGTQLFFRTNSMSVEVLATEKAGDEDRLWGLALKTDDIVATQKRLSDAGIAVSEVREGRKPGTKVCTAKSHVLDVPTLLIEHPKN